MNVPTTRMHQQPLLLEPAKAAALDQLSKRLGKPKQEMLREAVDHLLSMHSNTGVRSLKVEILKDALRRSADLVAKLSQLTQKQVVWQQKCSETKKAIDDALRALGIENLV